LDQELVIWARAAARTTGLGLLDRSGVAKNSPNVTSSDRAMRSSELMDGDAWPFSTWDMKLAEKSVDLARRRMETFLFSRSCRNRAPTTFGLMWRLEGNGTFQLPGR
jgi:hypothetical protein